MHRLVIEFNLQKLESQAFPRPSLQSALSPTSPHDALDAVLSVGSPVPAVGRWIFSGARRPPTGHQSGACWLKSPWPSSPPCGLRGGHQIARRIRAGVAASPGCHFQGIGLPGPPPAQDALRERVACGGRSFPAAAGQLEKGVEGGSTGADCFLRRRAGDTEQRLDAGPAASAEGCAPLSLPWARRLSGDPSARGR